MSVIDDFMSRYEREYDYYETAAQTAARLCELELEKNGIHSIVTYRAKRPDRLHSKLNHRVHEGHQYRDVDEIYSNIPDLAGVRIALYFPGDVGEVERILANLFSVSKVKRFPEESASNTSFPRRFAGYGATHYRVHLREDRLSVGETRFCKCLIEIQIASVLMHAWSEVEHDLVYKPLSGELTYDERSILDQLNGLVIAGEIALETLQRILKRRASEKGRSFRNHYELAAYLYDALSKKDPEGTKDQNLLLGRVDFLFALLKEAKLDMPEKLNNFVDRLDPADGDRFAVEQLIDMLLEADPSLNKSFVQLRSIYQAESPYSFKKKISAEEDNVRNFDIAGRFLITWSSFESAMVKIARLSPGQVKTIYPINGTVAKLMKDANIETMREFLQVQNLRNGIVHETLSPDKQTLTAAIVYLCSLLQDMFKGLDEPKKSIIQGALEHISTYWKSK